jgi:hypothetical protein
MSRAERRRATRNLQKATARMTDDAVFMAMGKDQAGRWFWRLRDGPSGALVGPDTRDVLEIGARLREVRNALYHGEWEKWLDVEFGWSNRTARRYMAVAKAFADKTDIVSDLPIDLSALYLLARPRTPPEVREQMIERAKLGERITAAVVPAYVRVFKGPPGAKGPPPWIPGPERMLIERCVEEQLDKVSWHRGRPSEVAAFMVSDNRDRAVKLARALIETLAGEELRRRFDAAVAADVPATSGG